MSDLMTYCQIRPDHCPNYQECERGDHQYIVGQMQSHQPIQLFVAKPKNNPDGKCSGLLKRKGQ